MSARDSGPNAEVRRRSTIVQGVTRVAALIGALAGELSDQRAYARHLAAHGRRHSAAEWRRFSDERLRRKYGQPRCC